MRESKAGNGAARWRGWMSGGLNGMRGEVTRSTGSSVVRAKPSSVLNGMVAVMLLAGVASAGILSPGEARAQSDAVKELAAPPAIQLPLKPSPEFAKFPRYAGMLGKRQIVLRLGPKTDDPSGVHGEYQFTDTGEVILIAGDRDGDTLEVEESNDGTHITGNWVGKFAADGSVAGDRMNVDDSDPQAFDLRPLAAGQPVPPPTAPAQAPAAEDAAPSAPAATTSPAASAPTASAKQAGSAAHAVSGVNNLTTGE